MKRAFIFIAVVIMMASCGTTRKARQTETNVADSTRTSAAIEVATHKMVDTTKTESGKVTVVEIEFYEPTNTGADSAKVSPTIVVQDDGIHIDNAVNVKTVKTAVIETTATENKTKYESQSANAEIDSVSVINESSESTVDETPVESPAGHNIKTSLWIVLAIVVVILVLVLILKFRK